MDGGAGIGGPFGTYGPFGTCGPFEMLDSRKNGRRRRPAAASPSSGGVASSEEVMYECRSGCNMVCDDAMDGGGAGKVYECTNGGTDADIVLDSLWTRPRVNGKINGYTVVEFRT